MGSGADIGEGKIPGELHPADGSISKGPIRTVAVLGCGLMGTGIAEVCVRAGFRTTAIKATPGDVKNVEQRVLDGLDVAVRKGKLEPERRDAAASLLSFTTDLGAVSTVDLVIESALETLPAKQALLEQTEQLTRSDAILATNTSSLPLRQVGARLTRLERFMGLHFFSPAVAMKLCEVSPTGSTDPAVVTAVKTFVTAVGKTPVLVSDEPGYIVNRLLVPYLIVAMDALESGVATAESIDVAMKLGCGHPLGPLALSDLIGLDVVLAMAKSMSDEYQDARYRPPPVLRRLVLANHLGRKTGAGFFLYTEKGTAPNPSVIQFAGIARGRAASGM